MVCVLMVASGAAWESTALGLLSPRPGMVVPTGGVHPTDLRAPAPPGQADVAVLALDSHGFDAAAVELLARHGVRPVAVAADPDSDAVRAPGGRIGVQQVVGEHDLDGLADAVLRSDVPTADPPIPSVLRAVRAGVAVDEPLPVSGSVTGLESPATTTGSESAGRVIVVWGGGGAPGRTTVAIGIAAEIARRGGTTLLVDADPYGGTVAQQLGILDEVAGMLSAARLAASGDLADRFASVQRNLGPGINVVSGLPRPDRWIEVRRGAVEHLLELGAERGHVVVDTGFALEADPAAEIGSLPGRNSMTLAALAGADEIVVVGSADPVGLSRLARGLVELREVADGVPLRVVVNRMRPSLGWSERDIAGMVEGFARTEGLHFLPDDRAAADRALVAGRTLVEIGDTPLLRAVGRVVDGLVPALTAPGTRVRTRRAGRAR